MLDVTDLLGIKPGFKGKAREGSSQPAGLLELEGPAHLPAEPCGPSRRASLLAPHLATEAGGRPAGLAGSLNAGGSQDRAPESAVLVARPRAA